MFRSAVLAVVLLTGCGNKTTTEARVVKVFQNTTSIKTNTISRGTCIWEKAEVSIFNQKDQKIKFDYLRCPNDEEFHFKVRNGNEIFAESNEGDEHIFSIWKTAPHTDKKFVESLIAENARDKCVALQDENNGWKISLNELDESFENGWVMYPPLTESVPKYSDVNGVCGPYGFNPGNDWVIGIKDGIGIAYSEFVNLLAFYDLNSITYENRG